MSTIWPDRTYQSRNTSSILSFKKVERTCASFSDVKIMIFDWKCPITEKKIFSIPIRKISLKNGKVIRFYLKKL